VGSRTRTFERDVVQVDMVERNIDQEVVRYHKEHLGLGSRC